ncbi:hypothetical protein [Cellulosimicrobium cellulans]|uniref:hypothetical protein n=1 Tax=Cellulosimicrobium cellulans TaxID=1710 RepID=UPI002404BE90|nr:hypothetical protein [Cellulosimicrobium cellulans]MDF9878146.1 hypothetical protein [Cellulosimicrobium cellulans]
MRAGEFELRAIAHQLGTAAMQMMIVPLVIALTFLALQIGARGAGIDPATADPDGFHTVALSILIVAFTATLRASWRPTISRWVGICTAAVWWWAALDLSAAFSVGQSPSTSSFFAGMGLGLTYALFFYPLGRAQSERESARLVAEALDQVLTQRGVRLDAPEAAES